MGCENFRDYMQAQIHAIEIHKWIESEKAGQDLGQEAVKNWIKIYSKTFRESWKSFSI